MSLIPHKEPNDPHHYKKARMPDGKHYQVFCQEILPNENEVSCRCSFSKRDDKLRADVKAGKIHTCTPGNPINTLTNFFVVTQEPAEPTVFSEEIIWRKAVQFAGKKKHFFENYGI